MRGKPCIPNRRQAGLHVDAARLAHDELVDRFAGDGDPRIARRHTEAIEHHHRICHRRINSAEPVLAINAFADEIDRGIDRPLARAFRHQRLDRAQYVVAQIEPLARGGFACVPGANSSCTVMPRGLRARGFFAISTSNGTITVRDQYDTFVRWNGNQRGKRMISTGITGTAVQGSSPKSASWMRVKTLACAAPPAARIACRARTICAASGLSPTAFSAK